MVRQRLLLLALLLSACSEQPEKKKAAVTSSIPNSGSAKEADVVPSPSPEPALVSAPVMTVPETVLQDAGNGDADVIHFPSYTMWGDGSLTHVSDNYPVAQKVAVEVDAGLLKIHLQIQESSHKEVNNNISYRIGSTVFQRIDSDDLRSYQASHPSFFPAPFVIFATSAEKVAFDRTSRTPYIDTVTFSSPMPSYVSPGGVTQFESILRGEVLTYTSQVTLGIGGGRSWPHPTTYMATMTLQNIPSTDGMIHVQQKVHIDSDQKGELYASFPSPRQIDYVVDPRNRPYSIVSNRVRSDYLSKDGRHESMTVNFNLCSRTLAGQSTKLNQHLAGCSR